MSRTPTQQPAADIGAWDRCVETLIGRRLVGEPDRRQRNALDLAAAALRAGGRADLVAMIEAAE